LTQNEIQKLWRLYQATAQRLHDKVADLRGEPRRKRTDLELLVEFNKIAERLEREGVPQPKKRHGQQ
jgi:hypothetical protein